MIDLLEVVAPPLPDFFFKLFGGLVVDAVLNFACEVLIEADLRLLALHLAYLLGLDLVQFLDHFLLLLGIIGGVLVLYLVELFKTTIEPH